MGAGAIAYTVRMDKAVTILDWLVAQFPGAKKTTLREMVERKRVRLNGAAVKSLKQIVGAGDKVEVGAVGGVGVRSAGGVGTLERRGPEDSGGGGNLGTPSRGPFPAGHGTPRIPQGVVLAEGLRVVHHDADILVVDKPSGLLTSTHSAEPRPTAGGIMETYVRRSNQKARALVVHRLDRDASGLLVLARSEKAYEHLKGLFAEHAIERRYVAIVHGVFRKPEGRLEHLLYEDERGVVHVTKDEQRGRKAALTYKVLAAAGQLTRVECTLETGRKHQIRVQMKAVGHPICGDLVYGTREAMEGREPPGRLALHATHLGFAHPKGGARVAFDSPPPAGWVRLAP